MILPQKKSFNVASETLVKMHFIHNQIADKYYKTVCGISDNNKIYKCNKKFLITAGELFYNEQCYDIVTVTIALNEINDIEYLQYKCASIARRNDCTIFYECNSDYKIFNEK